MAIYHAGYLSPIRKKLGNAVGRKWRTLDVLAVYQPNVSNPNTQAQQYVRKRFTYLAKMAMRSALAITKGFTNATNGTKVPPRSKFIGMNFGNVSYDGSYTVNYSNFIFSTGSLEPAEFEGSVDVSSPLTATVNLTDPEYSESDNYNSHDLVYLVAFDTILQRAFLSDSRVRRDDSISMDFPVGIGGHLMHFYLIAVGASGYPTEGKNSETVYVGSATVARG